MPNLEESRLFSTLAARELAELKAASEARDFEKGQTIFREGDAGDGMYVIIEGRVQISALVTESERRSLGVVNPGDYFGEMAVLDGAPRSASACAELPTKTLFIPRETMMTLVESSPRLAVSLVREFSQKMREFNRRYVQEVLQAERFAVVGRFARSIIHDLKNPLHIIGLAAEISEMEAVPGEMRKSATKRIRKQVDRLNNMISELLEFTRTPQRDAVLAAHHYGTFMSELLADLRPDLKDRGIELLEKTPPPDVTLPLDKKRMLHVFTNLLYNAVDAMEGHGTVSISYRLTSSEVVTEVADTGKGIAPEIAARLFEAFATFGKAKGSGLGLSICKRIVEDHGGWIRAHNQTPPATGAVFSFGLPLTR